MIFDFGKDSGYLGYLSGKQVNISLDDVWFLKDYPYAMPKVEKLISNKK